MNVSALGSTGFDGENVFDTIFSAIFTGKLSSIIGLILSENEKLSSHLSELETNDNSKSSPTKKLIKNHMEALKAIVTQLEEYSVSSTIKSVSVSIKIKRLLNF